MCLAYAIGRGEIPTGYELVGVGPMLKSAEEREFLFLNKVRSVAEGSKSEPGANCVARPPRPLSNARVYLLGAQGSPRAGALQDRNRATDGRLKSTYPGRPIEFKF